MLIHNDISPGHSPEYDFKLPTCTSSVSVFQREEIPSRQEGHPVYKNLAPYPSPVFGSQHRKPFNPLIRTESRRILCGGIASGMDVKPKMMML